MTKKVVLTCNGAHKFHRPCIDCWMSMCLEEGKIKTCPYCRYENPEFKMI